MVEKRAGYVFEFSWEVANKVGGIHTVIKSKISETLSIYGDNYFLIGPYFPDKAVSEFQEKIPPEGFQKVFDKLKEEGIVCHYGKWLQRDEPNAILVDYEGYKHKNNEIKTSFWEEFGIDSLETEFHDFDEPLLWGVAAARILEELVSDGYFQGEKVVAQFHEWLSCGALLHLRKNNVKVGTVFTTHGSMLARALAGNNVDLYEKMEEIDADDAAYDWGVHPKHQVEKVSAGQADVFTTVSEITAMQARHFLEKEPDVLLYNGLNIKEYPTFEKISVQHVKFRERIKEFIEYYFFPYYTFDLDNTLIYFTTGRYEFHNKGFDLFIESLGKLNQKMKEEDSDKTIVTFFWIPRDTVRIRPKITELRTYFEDIKDSIEDNLQDIENRIIRALIAGDELSESNLLEEQLYSETKKKVRKFLQKEGKPFLCSHDLPDEDSDPMLAFFQEHGLLNRKEDRVKVVFYPIYLTGADGLLDLGYNEAILGSHLGVFPSYYEPWGYTPVETAALGVASVTTDYAGFGRYLQKKTEKEDECEQGIFVIDMFNQDHEQKVDNLYECLREFSRFDIKQRVRNKLKAYNKASLVGWDQMITGYVKAHNLAVERAYTQKE